jgi:hypothetical protein
LPRKGFFFWRERGWRPRGASGVPGVRCVAVVSGVSSAVAGTHRGALSLYRLSYGAVWPAAFA